ncbi:MULTISPECIES: class A beta-lactamase [unclassified Streptomyces]|uniref:class A beta-lactamase n=1 Tax=unclassified Streptomyces TaxID=2593676 RepID=UPI0007108D6F|nr:class A beta-lactamase [Streptomyces sp. Root1310]KQX83499.1 class A beta-lactamase [Streptomyces sp. Root1310]
MLSSHLSPRPTRRTLLTAGAATTAALLTAGPAGAATDPVTDRLRDLEAGHGARLGVFAHNVRTGRSVRYRADERFPVCSLFKTLAVAAVLRDLPEGTPDRRVFWTAADVVENSPVTQEHVADGMTIAELSAAAIQRSDNTAGNLLLRELGGPAALTRFARSVGDRVTRLDRWEPELNSAEPDRITDTTSPYAIGRTYARLVLGDALAPADRRRLTDWMLGTVTSANRFRAGLPPTWTLADKTGGGWYGANNDAGIAWTPDGTPVVLVVQLTKPARDAAYDHELIVETAGLLAETLG